MEVNGRLALVLAAERLFAEQGLAAVSLRQINEAAGQRNASAVHYHFGDRDGVIRAVFEHRMTTIDGRRRALLEEAHSRSERPDVRFYVRAFVAPLAEQLEPRPEGNSYVRFLDHYVRDMGDSFALIKGLTEAAQVVRQELESLLAYLPAPLPTLRVTDMTIQVVSLLAQAEARLAHDRVYRPPLQIVTSNLIDVAAAGLTAPVSAGTLEALA